MAAGWEKEHVSGYVVVYMPIFAVDPEEEEPEDPEDPTAYLPVYLDLVSYQSNWELNGIPSCEIQVAVGREGKTLEVAAIHEYLREMEVLVPVEVYLLVELTGTDFTYLPDPWPEDYFLAFDGYVVGASTSTGFGSARIGLSCTHWMSDLAFSSAVSRSSSPRNPGEFSFGAAFRGLAGAGGQAFYSTTHPRSFITAAAIQTDLWGEGIAKWFDYLCRQDRFQVALTSTAAADKNNEALAALKRIEGFAGGDFEDYEYGTPLRLDLHSIGAGQLSAGISMAINAVAAESIATTTLWDRLAGDLAGQYLFAVVCLIDRALVVPFTPGLRAYWREIDATEYDSIETVFELPRPLRGVGLVGYTNSIAGGISAMNQNPPQPGAAASPLVGLGGYYENPDAHFRRGMTLIKYAPPWLSNITTCVFNGRVAADPAKVKSTAASPDGAVPASSTLHPLSRFGQAKTLWNDYARMLYVLERLKGRRMNLRGRLRFDIAPGSTVRVVIDKEKFVRQELGETEDLIGHVNRVTVTIDCEAMKAYTLFNLSHLRSDTENTQDATSTARHFLYEDVFTGAPLLPAVAAPRTPDEPRE